MVVNWANKVNYCVLPNGCALGANVSLFKFPNNQAMFIRCNSDVLFQR